MNAAEAKRELRRRLRLAARAESAARPDLPPDPRLVADLLASLPGARVVSCFVSVPGEPSTRDLLAHLVERYGFAAVPRVAGPGSLDLRRVDVREPPLRPGAYGIPEPDPADFPVSVDPAALDVVFVPGLAFDARGNRLGRGAGYYDRLLASAPRAIAIGLCRDERVLREIPVEPHDAPVAAIVTESRAIRRPGFPSA